MPQTGLPHSGPGAGPPATRKAKPTGGALGGPAGAFRLLSGMTVAMAAANLALQWWRLRIEGAPWPAAAAVVVCSVAFILLHLANYRIPDGSRYEWWIVWGEATAIFALVLLPGSQPLTFFLFLAVVSHASFVSTPAGSTRIAVAIWALAMLSLAWVSRAWVDVWAFALNALSISMGFIFVVAVSILARTQIQLRDDVQQANARLRRSHEELEAAHRRLQAYAAQAEELAAVRERNRLAQEIHDTLAHTLTGLIMQLEVVVSLLHTSGGPAAEAEQQALAAVQKALASAREGLGEVRRAVRALHPELLQGRPLGESLRQLAAQFSEQTGITVALRESGQPVPMVQAAEAALFRALQEMLTNAGRHGKASRVDVLLQWTGDAVQLSAYDDGTGAPNLTLGFGLLAMKERAAAFGGTAHIDNRPGEGFGVIVALPLRSAAAAPRSSGASGPPEPCPPDGSPPDGSSQGV